MSDPTAQRIVAAARAHFLQHGFRGVTMDDLAREMGMSKKTLYVHFPGKRALLEAVVQAKFASLQAEMEAVRAQSGDFAEQLHGFLTCLGVHARELNPTFVRDMLKEAPDLVEQVKIRRREIIARTFGELLRSGQKAKSVRDDLPVEMLVSMLLAMAESLASPANLATLQTPPEKLLSGILSVFLQGSLTEKGRSQL